MNVIGINFDEDKPIIKTEVQSFFFEGSIRKPRSASIPLPGPYRSCQRRHNCQCQSCRSLRAGERFHSENCYDKSSSILVTFTGSVKARMLRFLSSALSLPQHLNLTAPSATALGYPVVLHNLQVSVMGGRHLRATGLTLFEAWAGETELPSTMADRFLDVNDQNKLHELTLAAMHAPMQPKPEHLAIDPQALVASRTRPSTLLDVNSSLPL